MCQVSLLIKQQICTNIKLVWHKKTMCDRCSKAFLQTTGVLRVVLPNMSAAVSLSVSSDVRLRFSWTTATYQGSRKLHWT